MKSLQQFFSYMNETDFQYVVLRNFEDLPESANVGGHNDLDLLVYDYKHFKELFPEVLPEHPFPRVQHKLKIGDENVFVDVRYVGDGYYPINFQMQLLNSRVPFHKGFYTPEPSLFRLALLYHVVHHKGRNTYQRWIGDLPFEDYVNMMKESSVGYVLPSDGTVGRFNQYWKGATSIVSKQDGKVLKKQTAWTGYKLIDNEHRMLNVPKSVHFPTVEMVGGDIEIEDCGERLVSNLPDNWKEQLIEILEDLKKANIIHRDIKPDNLMVKDGVVKLIDFGWAKYMDEEDAPPHCLGMPYKPSWGWDDKFSMRKVIKEIEFELEEGDSEK